MTKVIDLKKGEFARHVSKAVVALKDGFVIAIPAEHGYVYVVDAFSTQSVRSMHVLRGSTDEISAQVAIKDIETASGISREISQVAKNLAKKNWPGLLTLIVRPHKQLAWDLGDSNYLDEIAIRSPKSKFFAAIVKKSGPLAFVSVAPIGEEPVLDPKKIEKNPSLEFVFSQGKLRKGKRSTVVRAIGTDLEIVRKGAVAL